MIDKIIIHNPEKFNGIKYVTIEVYFIYVGKIHILIQKSMSILNTEKLA
ncbi:MAG: DUF4368 domain-containing protein [Lachnospiraceae bacterium]|nr:DUF4368 domain-containing protein [Lachnospiraceae bacterium]